ncbi:ankyrin repeat domain-containing protein [Roseateles amylovorans]|uniref:Ankyrin repeat domain-containing protein n=1 Tax=Roseateles amylovorans TaxID=2978473 RepID=A0ABY6AW92_9BURK|nr:ankyrin repeat domain-containing protein [Roseateles amylovorans]UXH76071.1 ankyrin repeat domain-containing protein [Roseateles amylovorans]
MVEMMNDRPSGRAAQSRRSEARAASWNAMALVGLISLAGLALPHQARAAEATSSPQAVASRAAPVTAPTSSQATPLMAPPTEASRAAARAKLAEQGLAPTAERLVQYAAQGDATIVGWLLAAGVPAASVEPVRQVTPLHNAAAQGHERVAVQLLNAGAPVNPVDWQGYTPLALASACGHLKLVQLLLAKGATVNPADPKVASPLSLAVQAGQSPVVKALLAAGATQQANVYGQTPLDLARRIGRTDLVQLLEQAPATAAGGAAASSSAAATAPQ